MHQQRVFRVQHVVVGTVIVGAHDIQRLQCRCLGSLFGEFAGAGQALVVVQDAGAQLDLRLQRVLAGFGKVQVLHARGDDGQCDDADRDQGGEQVELAPDGEVGKGLVPAAE
ncbi:hypothetical protein D3C81_2008270 [compost metagenome]